MNESGELDGVLAIAHWRSFIRSIKAETGQIAIDGHCLSIAILVAIARF